MPVACHLWRLMPLLVPRVSDPVSWQPRRTPADPAPQEPTSPTRPAHIATVDGNATLERDGRPESGLLNMPLIAAIGCGPPMGASRSSSATAARCTLMRSRPSTCSLTTCCGCSTAASRDDRRPGPAVVVSDRLAGRRGEHHPPGDYRLSLLHGERETQLELAVLRGLADISHHKGQTPVRAGQRAYASAGLAPSFAYAFNSAAADDFDHWVENRRGRSAASRRNTWRLRCNRTRRCSTPKATGATTSRTATSGIRASRRLASVLLRPMAVVPAVRLDVGGQRSLRMADASLRPLGLLVRRAGSGFRARAGRRPTSRGRTRRAT